MLAAERCLTGCQLSLQGTAPRATAQRCGAAQVTAKRDKRDAAREEARVEVRAGRGGAAARAKASAVFVDDAALAPVLDNSLGWGAFMATSANVRYQLINAFEERFLVRARPIVSLFSRCLQAQCSLQESHWKEKHGRASYCCPHCYLLVSESSM